jgi:hypothetical protein
MTLAAGTIRPKVGCRFRRTYGMLIGVAVILVSIEARHWAKSDRLVSCYL